LFFISGTPITLTCPKSCPKNGDVPKSPFLELAAMVPIGRHAFKYRRWFVPLVPSAPELCISGAPVARAPWPSGRFNRSIEEEHRVQVLVRDNNVDQALKVLKKKMQREGVFREMKLRSHYEKPSERRVREKAEAIRRARKLARKKLQREGLLPMKPRAIPGAFGKGGPPRAPRF
jgi:small subunit ribosomal protein S21